MGYVELWDEYQEAVEQLYLSSPFKTRYVSKYRHKDGKLVLKVTDGPTCLKFRTDRLPDLKKFERLNLSLMEKMQGRKKLDAMETDVPEVLTATSPNDTPVQSPPAPAGRKGKGKKKNR
ncbi:uncharacterized protein SPPG_08416 [Spizellomyces punctatus DAOM BR117]|uniref:Signal recognition particle 9 kDa protein n=1 Tax=Spizellomyces punctatus (strain DAOM BR117) TaxID=645134 RepID=A0A0L0H450_SPIPD|nr:uncharacterized protein SPPG_08416 [Spizellomyces punctatus DAOM BR117]KNC96265.1 hypothetical protein SPPG_08416 [Spizellomyces punctatus DAOM BR117]|eukprot:XP_016604305.1 hypothetical protein SPPG_08416 [Spizellomyces punctatus DAOM BR117]